MPNRQLIDTNVNGTFRRIFQACVERYFVKSQFLRLNYRVFSVWVLSHSLMHVVAVTALVLVMLLHLLSLPLLGCSSIEFEIRRVRK